ncbi:hypothetical protein HK105_202242 [Polyrhizophydium stewartii]|uniref:Large-conductance mechanosensitive channel n=1 Tax=Polyrhizophydium stewartii TaxID=2732419 RepID=A0ABR4NFQ9_9FUNG|nr:hypothetical protein HK105_007808 [Polyrhizophydium stewartii]
MFKPGRRRSQNDDDAGEGPAGEAGAATGGTPGAAGQAGSGFGAFGRRRAAGRQGDDPAAAAQAPSGGQDAGSDNDDNEDDGEGGALQPLLESVEGVVVHISETARAGASVATRKVVGFWKDFVGFLDKGPVVELGVGVITGAAFSNVLSSFVDDILTPPLSFISNDAGSLRNVFFVLKPGQSNATDYPTLELAKADGAVTENVGLFADRVINFLVVMLAMFWVIRIYRQAMRRFSPPPPPPPPTDPDDWETCDKKTCPWCRSKIHALAMRCRFCTAMQDKAPPTLKVSSAGRSA